MNQIVYVNGEYVAAADAKVSVFDRGFLMADAVYEVTSVLGGKLIDFQGHCARLQRSLSELQMRSPVTMDELLEIHREVVRRNELVEGGVYLQVTRGAPAARDFAWWMRASKLCLSPMSAGAVATSRRRSFSIRRLRKCRPRRQAVMMRGLWKTVR